MVRPVNIGVIGIKGAWSTESLSQQLRNKGSGGAVIEMQELSYDLSHDFSYDFSYDGGDKLVSHPDHDLLAFDAFLIKKMGRDYSSHLMEELELLEMLEGRGLNFFPSPRNIRKMISRLGCTILLRNNDIPMPPTFITRSIDEGVAWVVKHGPAILKPLYSSRARGLKILHTAEEAQVALSDFVASGEKIMYLQKKLDLANSDYGLVFLGGNYVGAYARVGDGSTWHTTTESGRKYEPYSPPQAFIDIAERAQRPFGLDFCSVDVADSAELGPIVFEVSAFGGYKGLFDSSGIDASELVADYAIEKLMRMSTL